ISVDAFDAIVRRMVNNELGHAAADISQLPDLSNSAKHSVNEIDDLTLGARKFLIERVADLVTSADDSYVASMAPELTAKLLEIRSQLGHELLQQEAAIALDLEHQARTALEEVERVTDAARQSAGMLGTAGLASHFLRFAAKQQVQSIVWQ